MTLTEHLRESGVRRMREGRRFRKHMRKVRRCQKRCGSGGHIMPKIPEDCECPGIMCMRKELGR